MNIKSYYWAIFAAAGVAILLIFILPILFRGDDESSPHAGTDISAIQADRAASDPVDYSPQIEAFNDLVADNPGDAMAIAGLGDIYMGTGSYSQAVDQYNAAIAIEPGDPVLYARLGEAYYAIGMIDVAIRELEKGLAIDPNSQPILLDLGNIYAQTGKQAEAKVLWQKAYDVNPKGRYAHVAQQLIAEQDNPGSTSSAPAIP